MNDSRLKIMTKFIMFLITELVWHPEVLEPIPNQIQDRWVEMDLDMAQICHSTAMVTKWINLLMFFIKLERTT